MRADLIRHVDHLLAYYNGDAIIEVMAYGPGLRILLDKAYPVHFTAPEAGSNVRLVACQNTMQRLGVSDADFSSPATVVPAGLGHIVDRQLDGWAYLKA